MQKTETSGYTLLIIEDDPLFQNALSNCLKTKYQLLMAEGFSEAKKILTENPVDLVILDIFLPEGEYGIDVLKEIKNTWHDLPVIMFTAVDKASQAVESMKLGAFDYLTKTAKKEEILVSIERALESRDIKRELNQHRALQISTNQSLQMVGVSAPFQKILQEVTRLAGSDVPVLILGETGTGKELVSRLLHSYSPRASRPFVAINCGAIPKDLFESEFFGSRKGAYTGAGKGTVGKFELAHQGTLLLDEIGDLPLGMQTKLLRVLEEKQFYPLGSTELKKVDVRVLASTNRDLSERVSKGEFREDLFFRLNVFPLLIPPLRERKEDILALAHHFIGIFNIKYRKNFRDLEEGAREILLSHLWRGNCREIQNILERVVFHFEGTSIQKDHLLSTGLAAQNSPSPSPPPPVCVLPEDGLDEELKRQEMILIKKALEITGGNKTRAAKLLQVSPPTLHYRMEKHNFENP